MSQTRTRDDGATEDVSEDERPSVTAHECTSDRTVFTESDNNDAWIATDLTVTDYR